jgi:hypothetical protein
MKSQVIKNRYIIECECSCPDHLLVFDPLCFGDEDCLSNTEKEKFKDLYAVYIEFISNYHSRFLNRLKEGFKYIFFKEPFIKEDSVGFLKKNISQIKEIVEFFEKN